MKILHINKYFYPRGGPENYLFRIMKIQEKQGHDVAVFSMQHPENIETEWSDYFVDNIDYSDENNLFYKLKNGLKIIYSFEALEKFKKLVEVFKPDICHFHNFWHQITPSVMKVIKDNKIPAVIKLTDYKLVCPSWYLTLNGNPCFKCSDKKFYNAFFSKCHKNSYLKSFLIMLESYIHHYILKSYSAIKYYICPSKFLMNKVQDLGLKGNFIYLPNFVESYNFAPQYKNDSKTIAYWGRISKEKGVLTLIKSVQNISVNLLIIGEGLQQQELEAFIAQNNITNVIFTGAMPQFEIIEKVKNIMFSVCPSECFENNPNSVIESFVLGKPVIGADIGGIPELVKNNETGLLFKSGDENDLKNKILYFLENKNKIIEYGMNARDFVENKLNAEFHYKKLLEIYNKAKII